MADVRRRLDSDSLMIGIIIAVLVQAMYEILKNDYAFYYPSLPANFVILLSAILAVTVLLGIWKIPIAFREWRQGINTGSRRGNIVFVAVIVLFALALFFSRYETKNVAYALLVIIFGFAAFFLALANVMQIGRRETT